MGIACQKHSPIRRMVLNDVGPVLTAASLQRIGSYLGRNMHFDDTDQAVAHIPQGPPHRLARAPMSSGKSSPKTRCGRTRPVACACTTIRASPMLTGPWLGSDAKDISLWELYDKITCPVLVVRGEHSDLLTTQTLAEMSRRGPRAITATIQGVGHAPMFVTDEQIQIAREFLLENRDCVVTTADLGVKRLHVGARLSEIAIHHGVVYLAGQIAEDRSQDMYHQTIEVLGHIDRLLQEAGSDKSLILSAMVLVS